MIAITPNDYLEMRDFALNWRWTDPNWNCLPCEDVEQIHPIRPEKAIEIEVEMRRHSQPIPLRIVGTSSSILETLVERGTVWSIHTSDDAEAVRNWLRRHLPQGASSIVISWYHDVAVQTTTKILIKYWDDFLYPMNDNAVISSLSFDWFLYYHNEERLYFWRREGMRGGIKGDESNY